LREQRPGKCSNGDLEQLGRSRFEEVDSLAVTAYASMAVSAASVFAEKLLHNFFISPSRLFAYLHGMKSMTDNCLHPLTLALSPQGKLACLPLVIAK
jgi:hypothetical protein